MMYMCEPGLGFNGEVYSCDESQPLEASIVILGGVVGSARLESCPYNKFKVTYKLWLDSQLAFKNIRMPVLFCDNHVCSLQSMVKALI